MKKMLLALVAAATLLAAIFVLANTKNNRHEVHADEAHVHCICGTNTAIGDHTTHADVTWTAWTSTTALPTVANIPTGETKGYFYLTEDVSFSSSWKPGNAVVDCGNKELCICLNGHTVTKTGASRMATLLASSTGGISVQSQNLTVTLTDCNETPGKLTRSKKSTNSGAHFWFASNTDTTVPTNAVLNFFHMTMTEAEETGSDSDGGSLYISSNAVANLYDTKIIDVKTEKYGTLFASGSATFNLFSSTVSGCQAAEGGGIRLTGSSTANLRNSTIENCVADKIGGSIALLSNSNLNMWESSLINGTATEEIGGNLEFRSSGVVNLYAGTVIDGGQTVAASKNGGNISMNNSDGANGTLNMYDGVQIINGKASNIAGNLQLCTGTFNMYGGVIKDGIQGSTSSTVAATSNVHVYGTTVTFNMTGGTIEGRMGIKGGNVSFSKDAVVYGVSGSTEYGLTLENTFRDSGSVNSYAKVDNYSFGPFNEGAYIFFTKIDLSGNKDKVLETKPAATDYTTSKNNTLMENVDYSFKQYFGAKTYTIAVMDSDNDGIADRLKYYSTSGNYGHCHCVCGGALTDGKTYGVGDEAVTHHCVDVVWTKRDSGARPTESGHYYFSTDCTLSGSAASYGKNIDLCFNGHTVKQTSARLWQTNAVPSGSTTAAAASNFVLTDCVGTGGILDTKVATTATDQGSLFWTSASIPSKMTVYNGVYNYSAAPMTGNGGVIVISTGATFELFGGTIVGLGSPVDSYAGLVYLTGSSKVNIYGGTLTGGHSAKSSGTDYAYGGNVHVNGDGAVVNFFDGVISDGVANRGGNVCLQKGSFNMYGGTISGGSVTAPTSLSSSDEYGGNVHIYGGRTFHMYGGTITGGSSTKGGGNIRVTGRLIMEDGLIENGTASTGGNVFVNIGSTTAGVEDTTGKFIMNGGTISGGTSTGTGGNISINGTADYANGEFVMNGGTVTGGTAETFGGNIICNGDLTLVDGTITGGTANGKDSRGGNIYAEGKSGRANQPTLLLQGGEVSFGTATKGGGNVYVSTLASATIEDGLFYGGTHVNSDYSIPNVGMNGGYLTVTGGVFLRNREITAGSNAIWIGDTAKGCVISGGYIDRFFMRTENGLTGVITGGYFVTEPESKYLATGLGAVPIADPKPTKTAGNYTVTYLYQVLPAYAVTLSSETTLGETGIATLTGGGMCEAGTAVTVTAPEEANGYTFIGWYANATDATPVSTNAAYTIANLSSATTLVALYRFETAALLNYTFNGSNFKIQVGDAAEETVTTGTKSGTAAPGTEIRITFSGDKFLYWKNASEKIVTRDKEYEFKLYVDTELTAQTEEASMTTVIFFSDSSQLLQKKNTASELTDADLPLVPIRVGMTAGTWNKTLAEINAGIADPETTYIEVRASGYTPNVTNTVTVVSVKDSGWAAAGIDDASYEQNGNVPITLVAASAPTNYTFAYFATGSASAPKILSYSEEYMCRVTENVTVYAVYLKTAAEAKPTAVVTANAATYQGDGKYTLTIGVTRDVPEGYELVEQGILFMKGSDTVTAEDADTAVKYGGTGIGKTISNGAGANGVTVLNVKNTPTGTVLYAKGYVIFRKTDSDETGVVYSELAVIEAK